jgi:hypothetical protein
MYATAMFMGCLLVLVAFAGGMNSEFEGMRSMAILAIACFIGGLVFLIADRTRRPPPPPPNG